MTGQLRRMADSQVVRRLQSFVRSVGRPLRRVATRDRYFWLFLFAIGIVALAARLIGLTATSLWYDEVQTAKAVARSVVDLMQERIAEHHSPVFFLLLKGLFVPTNSIFLLRLPAALFGVATAIAAVFAARALAAPRAGWMAGALFALTPVLVDYGQEARPYTAATFGVVLAIWGAALIVRYPRVALTAARRSASARSSFGPITTLRCGWLLLGGGSIWAVYMHPLVGGLLWAGLDVAVGCLALLPQSRWRRLVLPWIGYRLACILMLCPLAIALEPGIIIGNGFYKDTPSIAILWKTVEYFFFFYVPENQNTFAGGPAEAVLTFLLLGAVVLGCRTLSKRTGAFAVTVSACCVPIILLGLGTLLTQIWIPRYLLVAVPPFALILATGLASAWPWRFGRVAVGGTIILSLFQVGHLQGNNPRGPEWRPRADWRPAVAALSTAPGENVIVANAYTLQSFEFEMHREGLVKKPLTPLDDSVHPNATYWLLEPDREGRVIDALSNRHVCRIGAGRGDVVVLPPVRLDTGPDVCDTLI
jgi:mannosyltransferase